MVPPRRRFAARLVPGLVLNLAVWLAGCSSDVNPIKAASIDAGLGPNPIRDAAVAAGYGPKPVEAPDFVAKSRREGLEYMPVGVSAPKPQLRARSSESLKGLEAELESARAANEARGRAAEGAGRTIAKGLTKGLKPAQDPADAGKAR